MDHSGGLAVIRLLLSSLDDRIASIKDSILNGFSSRKLNNSLSISYSSDPVMKWIGDRQIVTLIGIIKLKGFWSKFPESPVSQVLLYSSS
jgi:hypothetical protein